MIFSLGKGSGGPFSPCFPPSPRLELSNIRVSIWSKKVILEAYHDIHNSQTHPSQLYIMCEYIMHIICKHTHIYIIYYILHIIYYIYIYKNIHLYSLFYCHIFGPNPMAPDLPVVPGPQRSQHCCYRCLGATDLSQPGGKTCSTTNSSGLNSSPHQMQHVGTLNGKLIYTHSACYHRIASYCAYHFNGIFDA